MLMRTTVFGLAAAVVMTATQPAARALYEGPWCAIVMIGEGSVAERCDMRSFEMCLAEIRGQGASHCTQNPRYRGAPEPQRRKQQRLQ
jgi:hypothetical protein